MNMNLWTRFIGVLVLLYAAFVIYRGRIREVNEYTHMGKWIERSERPVRFWFTVAVMVVIAAVLILNVFHF